MVEEVDITATPEGIQGRSMDPSHVALVDFSWKKEMFTEYTCPTPIKTRINVNTLIKKLRGTENQELHVTYNSTDRKLRLVLKGKWQSTFTEPTLDPGDEEVPTPKIAFNTKIRLPSSALKDVIDQVQTVSDNLRFTSTPAKLMIEGVSELSQVKVEAEKGTEILLEFEVKEPEVKSTYNINYLTEIAKTITGVSELITVEYSTNMPIKISAEPSNASTLVFFLAPRIEAE